MTTSAVSANSASASAVNSPDVMTGAGSTLNQTDFLKLLVAQIQYQDPINPQSDTQMAAQMAQFSSLAAATPVVVLAGDAAGQQPGGSTVRSRWIRPPRPAAWSGVVMSNGTPEITVGGTNYKSEPDYLDHARAPQAARDFHARKPTNNLNNQGKLCFSPSIPASAPWNNTSNKSMSSPTTLPTSTRWGSKAPT